MELTTEEVLSQAQIVNNDTVVAGEHPLMGTMRRVRSPARFGGAVPDLQGHSLAHGEHTDTVLADYGFESQQVAGWRSRGVVD